MIYTLKVHASAEPGDLIETTHCAHGSDVLALAKTLIEKHPDCVGVEVLMLGSRLFFLPPGEPKTGLPDGMADASCLPHDDASEAHA